MEDLEKLRERIDKLDESLIQTLALRFQITDQIGALKKAEKLPAVDREREVRQEARIREVALKAGLKESVALAVLRLIVDAVVENHKKA